MEAGELLQRPPLYIGGISLPNRTREPQERRKTRASSLFPYGELSKIVGVCNLVVPNNAGGESWQVIGDPTEGALIVVAMKAGIEASARTNNVLHEIPFDSTRKAMSVVVRQPRGAARMYTKGAPEVILDKCISERRGSQLMPLTDERKHLLLKHARHRKACPSGAMTGS